MTFGAHTWLTQSSTQTPISLTSGEAANYWLVKTSSRAIGTHNLSRDLGVQGSLSLEVGTGSAAAKGIAFGRNVGRYATWKQAVSGCSRQSHQLDGKHNIADLMTQHVDRSTLLQTYRLQGFEADLTEKAMPRLGQPASDRSLTPPQVSAA